MKKRLLSIALSIGTFCGLSAQTTVTVKDADLAGTTTWTKNNIYLLDGFVFLESGTLTIEAGTVIKGIASPTTGDNASALIITRGAKINAVGTPSQPIIFTSEADDVSDNTDLGRDDRGLWGGVIILGSGIIGNSSDTANIEGIPTTEVRAQYGGNDNADNSGTLRYVSIRHGGAELSPGDEINGLTLGGVGSGTTIDHVEVFANQDDGIEWFGGAVDIKYAATAFCGDDGFDWDLGWVGKGQFWFGLQGEDEADNGGEWDGAIPDGNSVYSKPTVYNATFIGSGTSGATAANTNAILMRDATGGIIANSIFTDFANKALEIEDLSASKGIDSYQRMKDGDLKLLNNLWYGFGSNTTLDAHPSTGIIRYTSGGEDTTCADLITHMTTNSNAIADPMLTGISRITNNGLDPRPKSGSPAHSGLAALPAGDDWFDEVTYRGAFDLDASKFWSRGWTALDAYGHFADIQIPGACASTVTIQDADLTGTTTWTNDKCYLLDGFVFLESGKLTIQEGTVIKGTAVPGNGDNASALIITRGAQIEAIGTASQPIIFTSEADDVSDNTDLGRDDRGLWGGVIILGSGIIGNSSDTANIEGIPTTEVRAQYGGNDNADNSGTLRYVSIRHGGAELSPGDEINGLTLGGVGSGTTIDHVEVFANQDDGIEWFGGAVDIKYAATAFCGDDGFDWDLGWVGKGQFWFGLQGEDEADNGGEWDGAIPDGNSVYSKPTVYNATFIGSGTSGATAANTNAILMRDATGGIVANSIFTDFANKALEIEDLNASKGIDSYQRMKDGDLKILNNVWWGFGANSTLDANPSTGIIRYTSGGEDTTCADLITHMTTNKNMLENPYLNGISRTTDGGLDPRPTNASWSAVVNDLATLPSGDAFFTSVSYKGAFDTDTNNFWLKNWSALWDYGHFGWQTPNSVKEFASEGTVDFIAYPNPASNLMMIEYKVAAEENVKIEVYDLYGRSLQTLTNTKHNAGEYKIQWDVTNLPSGTYLYRISSETAIQSATFIKF